MGLDANLCRQIMIMSQAMQSESQRYKDQDKNVADVDGHESEKVIHEPQRN